MSGYIHPLVHVNRADPNDPFCGCHDDPKALCPRWREYGITEAEHDAAEATAREAMARLFPADDWPLPAVEIEDAEASGLVVRPESPAACCDDLATCETPYMHCTCRHYGQEHDGSPAETVTDSCPVHDLPGTFLPDGDEGSPF